MKNMLLKKQLLLLLLACISYSTVFSQVPIHEKYRQDIFNEIGNSDNLLYTFNGIPKEYKKQDLTLYNPHAKKLSTNILESKRGLELIDCISLGSNTLFYFDFIAEKTILLVVYDILGNEVSRKIIEYPKIVEQDIVKLSDNKFCLVTGIKLKKPGLQIECFDASLSSQWKVTKSSEETKYYYDLAAVSKNGNLAILYSEKMKHKFLMTIDADGNEIGNQVIQEEGIDRFKPYHLGFISNEEVMLVSDMGATTEDMFKALPTATNIKRFNLQGEEIKTKTIVFNEVQENFGDRRVDGSLFWAVSPSLRAVGMVNVNGKLQLVCESYQMTKRTVTEVSTTGGAPTKVGIDMLTLLDLYLIDLEDMSVTKRIWKPTRTVSIKGAGSYFSVQEFCALLDENNMFGFQFAQDEAFFIRSISQNYEYFNRIPFSANYEEVLNRTYWGTPVNDNYRSNGSEQLFYKQGVSALRGINKNGFLKTTETTVLYHLHQPTGELQFTILKQQ
ncbi:hypothetical protein DNU06_03215 [Putridiphycobacter roseus]|uniref:6-bladed beta-propeller n=1 Tax=Putridiphycobacter roseus TaxID=2219161 RepID=A0A2W1NII7_9FLAO|nr:hypothetical protein [Putridiphycobacter roseus]PZE18853.1 hypothetical protein DNU06_03215 [Putridiphycobacter roseus]